MKNPMHFLALGLLLIECTPDRLDDTGERPRPLRVLWVASGVFHDYDALVLQLTSDLGPPTWTQPLALRSPTATSSTGRRDMPSTSHPNRRLHTNVAVHNAMRSMPRSNDSHSFHGPEAESLSGRSCVQEYREHYNHESRDDAGNGVGRERSIVSESTIAGGLRRAMTDSKVRERADDPLVAPGRVIARPANREICDGLHHRAPVHSPRQERPLLRDQPPMPS